jgi:hypothetical protein
MDSIEDPALLLAASAETGDDVRPCHPNQYNTECRISFRGRLMRMAVRYFDYGISFSAKSCSTRARDQNKHPIRHSAGVTGFFSGHIFQRVFPFAGGVSCLQGNFCSVKQW